MKQTALGAGRLLGNLGGLPPGWLTPPGSRFFGQRAPTRLVTRSPTANHLGLQVAANDSLENLFLVHLEFMLGTLFRQVVIEPQQGRKCLFLRLCAPNNSLLLVRWLARPGEVGTNDRNERLFPRVLHLGTSCLSFLFQ